MSTFVNLIYACTACGGDDNSGKRRRIKFAETPEGALFVL